MPSHRVLTSTVDAARDLGPELAGDYRGYFVLQTPATLERYRDCVAPARPRLAAALLADWLVRCDEAL